MYPVLNDTDKETEAIVVRLLATSQRYVHVVGRRDFIMTQMFLEIFSRILDIGAVFAACSTVVHH